MNKQLPTRRLTTQRKIILQELRNVTSHPTADQIYAIVREKLPKISLGTVYRNLDVLHADGFIQIVQIPGGQKRFDGDITPHHHVVCIHCGRVGDVFNSQDKPLDDINIVSDFEILGQQTFFYGTCPHCKTALTN